MRPATINSYFSVGLLVARTVEIVLLWAFMLRKNDGSPAFSICFDFERKTFCHQLFSPSAFTQGFQLKISSTCTFVSCHSKQTGLGYHQELPKCVYFPVTKLNTAAEDCSIQCPSNSANPVSLPCFLSLLRTGTGRKKNPYRRALTHGDAPQLFLRSDSLRTSKDTMHCRPRLQGHWLGLQVFSNAVAKGLRSAEGVGCSLTHCCGMSGFELEGSVDTVGVGMQPRCTATQLHQSSTRFCLEAGFIGVRCQQ